MLDFFYSVDSEERVIQNSVFEFCDLCLEDILKEHEKKNQHLPMLQIKNIMFQTLKGLEHMHKLKILHRDLKPENILVMKETQEVKICDFGSSKLIDEKEFKNTPYVVSRYYRAPELILASSKYTDKIDIWAVGCILFELLTRTPLFPGETEGL